MIQKTVDYIKGNQALTKEKTGVPGGILSGQGRKAMVLDITATALALFLALIFMDITLLIQTSMKVYHSSLGPFHKMMFLALRMSLALHGKWLAEC